MQDSNSSSQPSPSNHRSNPVNGLFGNPAIRVCLLAHLPTHLRTYQPTYPITSLDCPSIVSALPLRPQGRKATINYLCTKKMKTTKNISNTSTTIIMLTLLIFTPYEPTINGLEARCARILCAKKPVTHKVTCALSRTSCASLVVASPFFLSFYSHFKDKLSTQSASTASFHYFRQPPPPHPTTRHNKHIHIYYSHVLDTFRIRSRSQHLFT